MLEINKKVADLLRQYADLLWQDGERCWVLALWDAAAPTTATTIPVQLRFAGPPRRIETIDLRNAMGPGTPLPIADRMMLPVGGTPLLLRVAAPPR